MPSALFSGTIIPCAFYGAPPSMHFRIALCSPYSTENAARLSPPRARCKHFCPSFFCITGLYSNRIFISLPYIYSFVNTFFAFYPHINCIFTLLYEYRRKSVKIMGGAKNFPRAPIQLYHSDIRRLSSSSSSSWRSKSEDVPSSNS